MHTIATEKQILKKFADDTKIAQFIESPEELQETLNRLSAWALKWSMEFNVAKSLLLLNFIIIYKLVRLHYVYLASRNDAHVNSGA